MPQTFFRPQKKINFFIHIFLTKNKYTIKLGEQNNVLQKTSRCLSIDEMKSLKWNKIPDLNMTLEKVNIGKTVFLHNR